MPKKYRLLIDSPDTPMGTIAEYEKDFDAYKITLPCGVVKGRFKSTLVEDRPTVWQEIVEEPEKKIVERWRGEEGEIYHTLYHVTSEDNCVGDHGNYNDGDYFRTETTAKRARTRTEIMCRLMGLAETIEEGSTEMKGAWTIGFDTAKDMDLMPIYTNNTVLNTSKLATFNTKENTQLFLDSAGQDALDWYGAVK